MKLLKLWRTFNEGFRNFYRNGLLTVATVSVLGLSLFVVGFMASRSLVSEKLLKESEEKVNITAYFNPEVEEEKIIEIKSAMERYEGIKSVAYVSRNQALDDLRKGNNDPIIGDVIAEIGENPLLASLVIKANQADQYEAINQALEQSDFRDKISRINYQKNKEIIGKINETVKFVKKEGLVMGLIFVLIAVLITFNTIRLTIYSHRQEFDIMRLVGASNMYVRMPFVFEGVLYGIVSAIIAMVALLAAGKYSSLSVLFVKGSILEFYFQNFWKIFGLMLVAGILMGTISGYIAIRKYLKK